MTFGPFENISKKPIELPPIEDEDGENKEKAAKKSGVVSNLEMGI